MISKLYLSVLFVTGFLLCVPSDAVSQVNKETIRSVESYSDYIKNNLKTFEVDRFEVNNTTGLGEVTFYSKDTMVVFFKIENYGELGRVYQSALITNGKLLKMEYRSTNYNKPYIFDDHEITSIDSIYTKSR